MTVVITGAAHGLGKALVEACVDRGEDVTAVDHDEQALALLDCALTCAIDLTEPSAPQTLIKSLPGPVTMIIHCAGISGTGRFEDIPAEHHKRILALNLMAPMRITSALLTAGHCAPKCRHVFVGSLSSYTGYPGATSYAASKDGLASFAASLGKSLPRGMTAHCVFPGPLRTDHAAKYAPENSAETVARRQSPDKAAALILRALDRRQRKILPGAKAKGFALAARLAPRFVERALVKSLFSGLTTPRL